MKVINTEIPEVLIIQPHVFEDERGFFYESFNQKKWEELTGVQTKFVQDNFSHSGQGVLRGLHYQLHPFAQGKLVHCTIGEVFDVAVDLRKNSHSFGRWVGVYLSAENKDQMWIPEGFAHGFLVLSVKAEIVYKTTNYYAPEYERRIAWNDIDLAIKWPWNDGPILSVKDSEALSFKESPYFE